MNKFIQATIEHLGGLDIMVLNHAAMLEITAVLWEGTEDQTSKLRHSMEVNFMSNTLMVPDAMPHLTHSNGSIAVVTSIYGKV